MIQKICFTGGGTGGHIYPALALIDALRETRGGGLTLFWIGQRGGIDRQIVEAAGVRFYGISAGKFRRSFSPRNLTDIFRILAGIFQARRILRREAPDVVFSKGGFVSVPPVLAAASLKIPLHTHESDFSPGLATRINARFAARIWLAYAETARHFPPPLRLKTRVCGNPIRAAFRNASAMRGREFIAHRSSQSILPDARILLVLGGSQGAHEVNTLVDTVLPRLTADFFVVHQTGTADVSRVPRLNYLPLAYINDEMPDVLASASLVLGRSGAGTVWEAAAAGIPMVLVPLAGSGTRGDQVENARYFERRGAAVTLVHPSPEELAGVIEALVKDETRRASMSSAARQIGGQDAVTLITAELSDIR